MKIAVPKKHDRSILARVRGVYTPCLRKTQTISDFCLFGPDSLQFFRHVHAFCSLRHTCFHNGSGASDRRVDSGVGWTVGAAGHSRGHASGRPGLCGRFGKCPLWRAQRCIHQRAQPRNQPFPEKPGCERHCGGLVNIGHRRRCRSYGKTRHCPSSGWSPGIKPGIAQSRSKRGGTGHTGETLASQKFKSLVARHGAMPTCFAAMPRLRRLEAGDLNRPELLDLVDHFCAPSGGESRHGGAGLHPLPIHCAAIAGRHWPQR